MGFRLENMQQVAVLARDRAQLVAEIKAYLERPGRNNYIDLPTGSLNFDKKTEPELWRHVLQILRRRLDDLNHQLTVLGVELDPEEGMTEKPLDERYPAPTEG